MPLRWSLPNVQRAERKRRIIQIIPSYGAKADISFTIEGKHLGDGRSARESLLGQMPGVTLKCRTGWVMSSASKQCAPLHGVAPSRGQWPRLRAAIRLLAY